jgi:hypothetical protein
MVLRETLKNLQEQRLQRLITLDLPSDHPLNHVKLLCFGQEHKLFNEVSVNHGLAS